jgi:predicted acylesterase/phospholipase RssA
LRVINIKSGLLLSLILLVFLSSLYAQDFPDRQRPYPQVALVLSGGAALGIAHIGVLKVLEETGIPLDLVVGNSMGSLVGGLYAAGYSPGDMEELVSEINWNWLFNQDDSYGGSRLIDTDNKILTLEFDKYGISNSNGLVSDQKIYSMLSRLTYRVSMVNDFENLLIPFKALAVDLQNGNEVVMDHGSLGLALRASMSIPVIFPPVSAYGGILVDGGVLNNNPVDVAVRWGADIIISVNVENFQSMEPEDLANISDVANQTIKVLLNQSKAAQASAKYVTLQINPDLSRFSRLDFFRARDLALKGEQAARDQLGELTSLAEEIRRHRPLEKKDWRRRGDYFYFAEPVFDSVKLSPSGRIPSGYLDRAFRNQTSQRVDFKKIERSVEEITARGDFASLFYSLEPDSSGGYALVLAGHPSRARAHDLYFGLNFDMISGTKTAMEGEALFALNLRDLTGAGSDWFNSFTYFINEGLELNFSYTQPVTSFLKFQTILAGAYRYSHVSARSTDDELSSYFSFDGGINLEFCFLDWWDFDLGYQFSQKWYTRYENLEGIIDTSQEAYRQWLNIHSVNWATSWDASTMDPFARVSFKGSIFLRIPFAGSGMPDSVGFPYYDELILNHRQYHIPNESRTFYYDVNIHSYRGEVVSPWNLPNLTGKDGIPGYASEAEFRGRDKIVAGIGYLENLSLISDYTGFDTYFSVVLRMGNIWEKLTSIEDLSDLKYGVGAGLEMQTNLGVFSLGLGVALDRTWAFYLYFN